MCSGQTVTFCSSPFPHLRLQNQGVHPARLAGAGHELTAFKDMREALHFLFFFNLSTVTMCQFLGCSPVLGRFGLPYRPSCLRTDPPLPIGSRVKPQSLGTLPSPAHPDGDHVGWGWGARAAATSVWATVVTRAQQGLVLTCSLCLLPSCCRGKCKLSHYVYPSGKTLLFFFP